MARISAEGYCWPQSIAPGDDVSFHLSVLGTDTDAVTPVTIAVSRLGGTRDVVATWVVDAASYAVPGDAAIAGCRWPATTALATDDEWSSGFYEVAFTVDDHGKSRVSHAFFVVRPAAGAPSGSILLALATNTWHAYNDFGGANLYTGATQVSLTRPMSRGYLHKPPGPGRRVTALHPPDPQLSAHVGYLQLNHLSPWAGSAGWPDWEEPFLAWAERDGFAVDVCTNADLEDHPELLDDHQLLLSVGHDEYWSSGMRDTVEAFTAHGGNVAFFSGNTSLWQVRLEDHTTGDDGASGPAETMVGYKGQFRKDPVYDTDAHATLTSIWSDHTIGRPENLMTGVSFTRGGYHRIGKRVTNGAGGYTLHRADHWIFDGTGLDYGDVLGAGATIVGYECDGCDFTYRDGLPYPTGSDGTPSTFTILGSAPTAHFTRTTATRPPKDNEPSEIEFLAARLFGTRDAADVERIAHGHAILGVWTSPAGGTVVTSGSTDWAHGLGADRAVEQITRNILTRLS